MPRQVSPLESLTARQAQVLDALIKFGNNKGAARALGVTERAIEQHLCRVREKLDTHTIGACVMWAKERSTG